MTRPDSTGTVLITGITGQDGSFLAEHLLSQGYEVYGLIRRSSTDSTSRIRHIMDNQQLRLVYGDVVDSQFVSRLILETRPHSVFNLAGQTHVGHSFHIARATLESISIGTLNILEAIRLAADQYGTAPKLFQASSSEMFGNQTGLLNEDSPFRPCSPYGTAKVTAHHLCVNYRESYGLPVYLGILFNHESERRGEEFVTRKITTSLAGLKSGRLSRFSLGNLDARRDWGYAPEYIEAMVRIMQEETPDDFVVATGVSHSVREFLQHAANLAEIRWEDYFEPDPSLLRPVDISDLRGDNSKMRRVLSWSPSVSFEKLVELMWEHDWELEKRAVHKLGG